MKKIYLNLEKINKISNLEENVKLKKREIETCIENIEKEKDSCKHNIVLFYGPNVWDVGFKFYTYQCLECSMVYESNKDQEFKFTDSLVIDVSRNEEMKWFVKGKKHLFNEIREKIKINPNITALEFYEQYGKTYEEKIKTIRK